MRELGMYIHIPFCKKKCSYCDFISFENANKHQKEYIEILKKEIEAEKNKEYLIDTIYIGGGTPSYLDSKYIIQIMDTIKSNYNVKENAEITIEVNPGTVNEEKIIEYKKSGINRISIGLQTIHNKLLKDIGRIHSYEEFLETYKLAQENGFTNINVDLMLALPNQTIKMLEESVKEIIKLNPKHISIYSLILEEGTTLYKKVQKGEIQLVSDEIERKMYWKVKKILEKNGYKHYEISNFSKESYESKHNTNCWKQKEYLGFGVAAHSYIENKRYSNTEKIEKYIENYKENRKINEIQTLEEKQKEYMILALRKIEGVNIQEFKNKYVENPLYLFKDQINKLVNHNLIEVDLNNIKLTSKGIDLANLVWEEFI